MNGESRRFCLSVIAQTYGYTYNPQWHADLDSLGAADDVYAPANGGRWIVLRDEGRIIACGGLRSLTSHITAAERFRDRYAGNRVGAIWRVYVDPIYQGRGKGYALFKKLEEAGRQQGYELLYLHASGNNPAAVAFWERQGFLPFLQEATADKTIHMEKRLS